jgi:hypothetical protein
MRSEFSSGTRVQYTHPPNGSLKGTSSSSTSVRLTPLGPMPRSDTPCEVGCVDRLLLRRKRLNVGICRSTSSATTAGDDLISSPVRMLTLAGVSPRRCSPRLGVTVTVSSTPAGATTTLSSPARSAAVTRLVVSAKPPARTIRVTASPSGVSIVNRPSGPLVICRSGEPSTRTMTIAPGTAAPDESWMMPVIGDSAAEEASESARTRDAIKDALLNSVAVPVQTPSATPPHHHRLR